MSIPALEAIRARFPAAHVAILARPWVADVYLGAEFCDELIEYTAGKGFGSWQAKWEATRLLREKRFDAAVILPNSFDSALVCWLARIPVRVGYSRDARGLLLNPAIAPNAGHVHERFYYLELLQRAGWIHEVPGDAPIHLKMPVRSFDDLGLLGPVIGLSPGAAFGTAKRWLPERFAESSIRLARAWGGSVAVFGSTNERDVATQVATMVKAAGVEVRNLAGETSLREFMERIAACQFFLTNDNGAMHLAAAIGVPTLAVFGSTDSVTTGPTGVSTRIVREPVECSPCLKRECPIDHRCMTRVTTDRVIREALEMK